MTSFDYQIIRRPRRRTVSISVKPDCSVRVMVPVHLPDQKIDELMKQKSKWIRTKIKEFQEIQRNNIKKEFTSGELFSYLGKNYRLKVITGDPEKNPVKLINGRFYVYVHFGISKEKQEKNIQDQLSQWYQDHSVNRIREKVIRYSGQLGVTPASVGIKGYKSSWGTCHSDGRIFINWRIILAPHSIVDYVVVHELCHLVHHDHSKKFWKLLGIIIPDYQERKDWLRINGSGLEI